MTGPTVAYLVRILQVQSASLRANDYKCTNCRHETSLHSANAFISPRLDEDIEYVFVDANASILCQLALELHARLGDVWDVGDRNLGRGV